MNRADLLTRLRDLEPKLRAHGVGSLYIYGSYARDEASSGSDIDILADFAHEPNLSRFMDALYELEEAFPGTEIGFNTRDGLVPAFRPHIESDAVRVF